MAEETREQGEAATAGWMESKRDQRRHKDKKTHSGRKNNKAQRMHHSNNNELCTVSSALVGLVAGRWCSSCVVRVRPLRVSRVVVLLLCSLTICEHIVCFRHESELRRCRLVVGRLERMRLESKLAVTVTANRQHSTQRTNERSERVGFVSPAASLSLAMCLSCLRSGCLCQCRCVCD